MCRLSRGVPGTTCAPMPETWSLTALSQVRPFFWPKYFGEGPALMVRTGTTNRSPDRGEQPTAPELGDRHLRLGGHQDGVGGGVGLGPH